MEKACGNGSGIPYMGFLTSVRDISNGHHFFYSNIRTNSTVQYLDFFESSGAGSRSCSPFQSQVRMWGCNAWNFLAEAKRR